MSILEVGSISKPLLNFKLVFLAYRGVARSARYSKKKVNNAHIMQLSTTAFPSSTASIYARLSTTVNKYCE